MIKDYYQLTKSGLVFGNVITVIGGFALASRGGPINFLLLLATIVGIFLVMASGCVFNNYIDRDIDSLMARTKDRALVTGKIFGRSALIFASVLGFLGFFILAFFTNSLTLGVAFLGFFFYVFAYSLWFKRRNVYGTVVGSLSGAVPPVVGYVAVSNRLDLGAAILFLILVVWQMPHFFAIAIRRKDEYTAAKIPVLPVVRGLHATKVQMLLYIIGFIVIAPLLCVFGYTGYIYLIIALILGLIWLGLSIKEFQISDSDKEANIRWARKMFLFSLIVLMVLFITITTLAII